MLPEMLNIMKTEEGFRQFPYRDTNGILTIGYGRNLQSVGLSEIEAEFLFQNDVDKVEIYLENLPWYLDMDMVRRSVVANMAFNLGITKFLTFTNFIDYLKQKNYQLASSDMLNTLWADQVGKNPGQRAYVLSNILLRGSFQ